MPILLIIFIMIFNNVIYAKINLQIDNKQIIFGKNFKLILSLDDIQDENIPDFTPLKKDFVIIGTERSMNYTSINGHAHVLNQWILILRPKRSGELTIPPIKFMQQYTNADKILVTAAPVSSSISRPIITTNKLITSIDNKNTYVNQQIIYTVKLYNHGNLLDAEYTPPKINDALLITLNNAKHYKEQYGKQNYVVDEFKYAIFPQKSGKLTINAPIVNAVMLTDQPQQVQITTDPMSLIIKSSEKNDQLSTWLPAKQIILHETYDNMATNMNYDSTLSRRVTVQGIGIAAQLLPNIQFLTDNNFSVYPEKPIENTIYQQNNLIGTTTIKVTYLFNHIGKIIIPKLAITWFNTEKNKFVITELPERVIFVKK